MKKYSIYVLLVLVAASMISCIQNSPQTSDSSDSYEGMSEERLMRIDAMLNKAIEEDQIPGAVALVARNGKIVYHKAFGMADAEANRSLQQDDIFRIASQTKAITSTAVMMLWEEGEFRLDDPVSKYIPEFENAVIFESGWFIFPLHSLETSSPPLKTAAC